MAHSAPALALTLCLASALAAAAPQASGSPAGSRVSGGPVVVIDPGHGGEQAGARGPGGVTEKQVALAIARRLARLLEKDLGATVQLTRTGDEELALADRVAHSNRVGADVFISLHANSMPTRRQRRLARGVVTFYLSSNASDEEARRAAERENAHAGEAVAAPAPTLSFILADLAQQQRLGASARLAASVQEALVEGTGAKDRGVSQAPFFVLTGVDAPAVLVEVGFISHPGEGRLLQGAAYQEKVARSLARGISRFLQVGMAQNEAGR